MSYDITCHICGNLFSCSQPNTKYCGKECRLTANGRQHTKIGRYKKTILCEMCGAVFVTKCTIGKFCSDDCRNRSITEWRQKNKRGIYLKRMNCKVCGREFETKSPGTKFCSKECLPINNRPKRKRKRKLRRYYVYIWFDGNVPIYIGKGIENRAWAVHSSGGIISYCERLRIFSKDFRVEILKDNLSSDEALELESSVIKAFSLCGLRPVGNQV